MHLGLCGGKQETVTDGKPAEMVTTSQQGKVLRVINVSNVNAHPNVGLRLLISILIVRVKEIGTMFNLLRTVDRIENPSKWRKVLSAPSWYYRILTYQCGTTFDTLFILKYNISWRNEKKGIEPRGTR